jgi:hypothetical protein
MGFYAMLAFNANAVELGLPHEMTEPPLPGYRAHTGVMSHLSRRRWRNTVLWVKRPPSEPCGAGTRVNSPEVSISLGMPVDGARGPGRLG